MGFLRLRPRSLFKRSTATQPRNPSKASDANTLDGSDRTYKMDLEEMITIDDSSHSDCSIEECLRAPHDAQRAKGPHSMTRGARRRVTFVDERRGLSPRHIVTETHYRPRTKESERRVLFYNARDFSRFEREELYDRIENEIRDIEIKMQTQKTNGDNGPLTVRVNDHMRIENLLRRARVGTCQ